MGQTGPRRGVLARSDSSNPSTSFNVTMHVLEEIGDRHGHWQNSEDLDLKDALTEMEEQSYGRVLLHVFYESSSNDGKGTHYAYGHFNFGQQ